MVYIFEKVEVASPLFPPLQVNEARLLVEHCLRQKADRNGLPLSRWTLHDLHARCDFIRVKNSTTLCRVLRRLGISYQRARSWIHSPDEAYQEKLAHIKASFLKGLDRETEFLFLDEFTYSIHATISRDYAPKRQQPRATRAHGYERTWRIIAAMNAHSGQLTSMQRAHIRVPTFVEFLKQVVRAYPNAKQIFIVLDNWPVHFHPDVIQALQKQTTPYPGFLPPSWNKFQASGKYQGLDLPIQLVPLPTYASWLNPIEKLWKWLKKDIIHHHDFQNDFQQLKQIIEQWLQKCSVQSEEMLQFCGLRNPTGIFAYGTSQTSWDG